MQRCIQMIELKKDIPKDSSLKKILSPDINSLSQEEIKKRYEIDRFLNFFGMLYHYTFITRVLSIPDIECFLWFIRRIGETPEIRKYCEMEGYDDVLELKEKCDEHYVKYRKPLTQLA